MADQTVTGVFRRLFWDPAKTTLASLGAGATPTIAELIKTSGPVWDDTKFVSNVRTMPDFGGEANPIVIEPFGEDEAVNIAGQAQPSNATVEIYYSVENARHTALYDLANGAPLCVGIFVISTPGTGANPKSPTAAGIKGEWRILAGTKLGKGNFAGGNVNDPDLYTFSIALATGAEGKFLARS